MWATCATAVNQDGVSLGRNKLCLIIRPKLKRKTLYSLEELCRNLEPQPFALVSLFFQKYFLSTYEPTNAPSSLPIAGNFRDALISPMWSGRISRHFNLAILRECFNINTNFRDFGFMYKRKQARPKILGNHCRTKFSLMQDLMWKYTIFFQPHCRVILM